ncbi:MAG: hypothetical protein C0614_14430, partial [Desulfuromonas sp.]
MNETTNQTTQDIESQAMVSIPDPGQTTSMEVQPGQVIQLGFDVNDQTLVLSGEDLRIEFANGAVLIFEDFATLADEGTAPAFMLTDGSVIPGDVLLTALTEEVDIETAAGEAGTGSGGSGEYRYDMGDLINGLGRTGPQDPDGLLSSGANGPEDELATPNLPPTATDDFYVISEGQVVTFDADQGLFANDNDPDGEILSVSEVEPPANISINPLDGAITINADDTTGDLAATFDALDDGESISYQFPYTVVDEDGATDEAMVTVVVEGVNDPPVAIDDAYTTNEDTPITIPAEGILANDFDVEDDPLSSMLVDGPEFGTLAFNEDGSFTYSPNENFFGTDSFTYIANDGDADSNVATVTINVLPVNDAPVAIDDPGDPNDPNSVNADPDAFTTPEDTPLVISIANILSNDIDIEDGTPNFDGITVTTNNGTLVNNGDGTLTYTPDPDYNGGDSFVYQVVDSEGLTATATVAITVLPVDDVPDAIDDGFTINEDTSLTIPLPGVLANDSIGGDGGTLAVVTNTNPANGSLTLNPDGSFSYTPNSGFNGTDSFTYSIQDIDGDKDTATVTINVLPVDEAPDAIDDSYNTDEDTPLTIPVPGVLTNDSIGGDGGTLAVVDHTDPSNGALSLNADGSFTYTPDEGWSGTDSFTYTIEDIDGDQDTATVTIN